MADVSKVPLSRLIPDDLRGMRPVIDAMQREILGVQEAQIAAAEAAAATAQSTAETAQTTATAAQATADSAASSAGVGSEQIRELRFTSWDIL